ncbi:unnamed protein product [Rotaria sordida]|uniref:F-box domain-containing protein n=1 Tax=Rotaria sordida TaxID=392033 RepID=A0A815AIF0_9BILA|nr:unnamed protein product [Rotaria sordida]
MEMSKATLLTLPVELIHCIFDHCDGKGILHSIRSTCTRLYSFVNTYNRFEFDFNLNSTDGFKSLYKIIEPKNVLFLNVYGISNSFNRPNLFHYPIDCCQLTQLRSVTFHGVSNEALEHFIQQGAANSLTSLTIDLSSEYGGNRITEIGAQYLADALKTNTTLTTLDIENNCIGDEGAKHFADALRNNTTLITLDIGCNGIADEGVQHLADALKKNTALKTLNLNGASIRGYKISDKGAEYLVDALKNNTTLTKLDIRNNWITNSGAQYLADALIFNIPLQWVNCSTWTDQLSIEKVEANMWPPKRNELLTVSVSGVAKESFIYGNYNKTIVYRGYSLPSIIGSLDDLGIKLPTYPGPLKMIIFNATIPDVAPNGQYDLYVKASEQDHFEVLCVKITWEL